MPFQATMSLPGTPFTLRRTGSKGSQFSWKKPPTRHGDRQPLVFPCLDNLDLPFADDSKAVTPTSDDLCNNFQNTHFYPPMGPPPSAGHHRRLSSTSYTSRMSQLESRFSSRRDSVSSHHSRKSFNKTGAPTRNARSVEPTHFHWGTSVKHRGVTSANAAGSGGGATGGYGGALQSNHHLLPEVVVDKTKSDDNVRFISLSPSSWIS